MVGFWKTTPLGLLSNELSKRKGQCCLLELWEPRPSGEEAAQASEVLGPYQHEKTWKYNEVTERVNFGIFAYTNALLKAGKPGQVLRAEVASLGMGSMFSLGRRWGEEWSRWTVCSSLLTSWVAQDLVLIQLLQMPYHYSFHNIGLAFRNMGRTHPHLLNFSVWLLFFQHYTR